MDYAQRVIIKFLFNDGLDAHQIAEKLKAQFSEDPDSLRVVQFRLTRCDEVEKTFTTSPGREDPRWTVYPPEFRKYQMKIHSNQLGLSLTSSTFRIRLC
jgi:hypothetical protein